MDEKTTVEKIDLCAKFFAKQLFDTGASEYTYTLEGFNFQGEMLGDVEVIVKKIVPPTPSGL